MELLRFTALVAALLLLASAADHRDAAAAEDTERLDGAHGLVVYIYKKGANMRAYRLLSDSSSSSSSGQSEEVEIFLDTIEERAENLEKLDGNHKTSSFANVDFDVATVHNVSLPLSESSGVYADCLNCSATLDKDPGKGARISLAVCAITGDATLNMDGELTNVTAGQAKIAFTMLDWPWSEGSRTNKLVVDIVIKVPPGRYVSGNSSDTSGGKKPVKFHLGADSFVEFSRKVYDDGAWKTMPAGYPKYISQGANNHFELVIGNAQSSIYDPNLEVGYSGGSSSRKPASAVTALHTVWLSSVGAALLTALSLLPFSAAVSG